MTDYIKREDAKELFEILLEHYHNTGVEVIKHTAAIAPKEFHVSEADDISDFNSEINGWKNGFSAIPSADVAPVRHGRWKHERLPSTSGGSYAVVRCSACEYQYPMAETRYCPNCGARMDDGYILITGKEQI